MDELLPKVRRGPSELDEVRDAMRRQKEARHPGSFFRELEAIAEDVLQRHAHDKH